MTPIIAISKPTKDALIETDPDDFIFHSDYDTLKYEAQGIITLTVNYANYYHTYFDPWFGNIYLHRKVGEVVHGLGYVPYFAGYMLDIAGPNTAIQAPFAFAELVFFGYLSVFADMNMVTSVIQNLVSNALKFTRTDGSGKVSIVAHPVGKNIEIIIHDTGLGMTQSQIEQLFEPQIKASIKGTIGERGTGLGLVLCKRFN